jgi:hypothetical protein
MANLMKVASLRRTGTSATPFRQIVVQKFDKDGNVSDEITLSTKIEKVSTEPVITGGGKPYPKEQYSFKVGKRIVYRFADAIALVAKAHHLDLNGVKHPASYVQEAAKKLRGESEIRFMDEETIGQAPEVTEEATPEATEETAVETPELEVEVG